MGQHSIPARLERDDANPTVAAFPDGSVDTFYDVSAGGARIRTREAFVDTLGSDETDVFALDRTAVEPGGHAVNVAAQADRLGNDVTLAGHLDDAAFADVPFDTVSMGDPARVSVYGFDDGDFLAVENSNALETWTLEDLRGALGEGFEAFLSCDVVCCANWETVENLLDALRSLADVTVEGGWFVFDPGSPAGRSQDDVDRLLGALGALTNQYDVVLAVNPRELDAMAASIGRPADDANDADDAALVELRERAGLTGAVVHGKSRAAVATGDGVVSDANFDVEPARHTGGGDRFDAGLAHALARGWDWSDALHLGNACASRYIATGETGSPAELAAFVRDHD